MTIRTTHKAQEYMKIMTIVWMAFLAFAGNSMAQQSDEEKRFNEQFDRSNAQALAAYPDAANPETALHKKVVELDNALKADDDPLFYSADKPMILVRQAAKALGIQPAAPKPAPVAAAPIPKFITADQVKAVWIQKLPQPKSMDKDYHKILKENKEFIEEIKDGKQNLEAQETAANYNKSLATSSGHVELAKVYEAELIRISEEKIKIQEAKQARRESLDSVRLQYEISKINRNLENLEFQRNRNR